MIYLLMFLAAIGMIFGTVKIKEGMAWGKALSVTCAILVILLAVMRIASSGQKNNRTFDRQRQEVFQREMTYNKVCAEKLAVDLAAAFPGSKAVIIRPPDMGFESPDLDKKIEGLKSGFGDTIEIIGTMAPPLPPMLKEMVEKRRAAAKEANPEKGGAMDLLMDETVGYIVDVPQINSLVKGLPAQADLLIFLMDFPENLETLSIWSQKNRPEVAGVVTLPTPKMDMAIEQGFIHAVVLPKPGIDDTSDNLPDDLTEAFNRRFLIVTAENIQAVSQQYPGLFPEKQ